MKTYRFKNGAEITPYFEGHKKLYMVTYKNNDTFYVADIMSWAKAKEIADNVQNYLKQDV